MTTYNFNLCAGVEDERALLHAAREKAVSDGDTIEHLQEADGSVNVAACLVTLLDPGTLAGCSIIDSTADRVDATRGPHSLRIHIHATREERT